MCFFRRDYERPELVVAPIDERRLQMFLILLIGIGIGAALVFLTGAMLTMPLLPTSRGIRMGIDLRHELFSLLL